MSLIEEALRQAKDPTLRSTIQEGADLEESPSGEDSPAPKRAHWRSTLDSLYLMAAAAVMVATVVLVGVSWFGGQARLHPSSLGPTESPTVAAKARSPRAGTRKLFSRLMQNSQEAFVVSGVVQGAGPSFAVINDEILAVGETINGATLLAIQSDTIRLRTAGGDELALAVTR